ncbi:peptidylprolyl isomerase [Luteirhabdus pelagi]|uniref:peptidylprolyl isomerase n=1 Tax=Luteirhabdus pelagi TaxID=2792783 RepID=UPI0019398920|nr:peptidylprolyl isomerase [Luteirhabdus pelagi]
MAVLNSIRKRGFFLILIIALALFAFILSDILTRSGGSNKDQDTVATINGTDINRVEFMRQVENAERSLGPNAQRSQAINMVWERELRKTLLEDQFEELGISVSKEQVNEALRTRLANDPSFQNETGQFDMGMVQMYVNNIQNNPQLKDQWDAFMQNIRSSILQQTYVNLVKGGMVSTIADGEQQYKLENNKVSFQYVQIPYTSIADEDVTVSESEIKNYIEKHPAQFEVDAQADIQYVYFGEEASQEDIEASREDMRALLNERVEYNEVSQINDTIPGFQKATNIEEFINANSDRPYTDRWYFNKDLPAALADTVPSMNEGAIYGPYQVDNTLNLTKVIAVEQLPDSVQSRHILIRYQGLQTASSDVTRTKEEAEQLADSLATVLKRDESKFEALATEFSQDPGSAAKGGDLGYVGPGRMVPAFNDFIFDNASGTIDVVETQFGYHVAQVQEKKNTQRAVKLATVTKEIEPSETTINDVFSKATNFEVAVKDKEFETAAEEQGVVVRPVNKMGELDANIPGVGNNRPIVNWAFNEESEVGDVKRFNVTGGYVIAQLTRRSEKGLMSVTEASATVTPILRNKKKAEQIRNSVSGSTLQEIASSQGVQVQSATAVTMASPTIPGAGREPKVVGAAFGTADGQTSGFINGNKGVYKVKVLSKEMAPEMDNYTSYVNQLNQKVSPSLNSKIIEALKANADIEDNRANFY